MSFFRDEIHAQAAVVRSRLAAGWDDVEEVAAGLRKAAPLALMIAARGTSDHAATYARYLFEIRHGIPVVLAAPSVLTLYGREPRLAGLAVLAISQSGASPDLLAVVEAAGRQGAPAYAIVNQERSPLAEAASAVISIHAGQERSVPASKTYTASLFALAMLSAALDASGGFRTALAGVPEAIETALDVDVGSAAAALAGGRLAVVGRGYNLATAQEIALKLTETTYSVAEARSTADFMHGPIAMVGPGFPVLLLDAAGPCGPELASLARSLSDRRAAVVRITDQAVQETLAISLPTGLPETLTPIPFAVAGQRLALQLAEALGIDPDRPRGLSKVTLTR